MNASTIQDIAMACHLKFEIALFPGIMAAVTDRLYSAKAD
jgi:hypothetical protein